MWRSVGRREIRQRGHGRGLAAPRRAPSAPSGAGMSRALLAVTLGAAWALVLALAVSSPASAHAATPRDSTGSLHIAVPTDANGGPAGPVGTYVMVVGSSLTPNGTYKMGVALKDAGCQGGYTDLGLNPLQANARGSLFESVRWPSSINNTGSSYYFCIQDLSGGGFVQSDSTFTVLGASPPSISVAHAQPTVGPGTPTPSTSRADNVYQYGESAEITGANFLPGGTNLAVYLATQPITNAKTLLSATPLQTIDGSTITSDSGGSFTATVKIQPPSQRTASYYLYVVSDDADTSVNARPSLEAERQIIVQPAPTPTATATATTPPPTATPKNQGGGGNDGGNIGGKRFAAIVGLGVLSVVLFIVGVILLASAATTPRAGQQR